MKRKILYGRLAVRSLRRNFRCTLPYLLTVMFTVSAFYNILAIVNSPMMESHVSAKSLLVPGTAIVGFFSVIILLYANRFTQKQRQPEIAAYSILGMEKRHIAGMMLVETVILFVLGVLGGLLLGLLLGQLLYWLLLRLLVSPEGIVWNFDPASMQQTVFFYAWVFLAILLLNIVRVHMGSPIALLQAGRAGEKEPRSHWVLGILGVLMSGAGYGISFTTRDLVHDLALLIPAVVLVILGTYLMFASFSIVFLKALRRKKSFYYRPGPFTAVSGLLYRMKQNALGLASICILSTMVLVTVSTTVSLYAGVDALVDTSKDLMITIRNTNGDFAGVEDAIRGSLEKEGKTLEKMDYREDFSFSVAYRDGQYITDVDAGQPGDRYIAFWVVKESELNRLTGEEISLPDGTMQVYHPMEEWGDTLDLLGRKWTLRKMGEDFPMERDTYVMESYAHCAMLVVNEADYRALYQAQAQAYAENSSLYEYNASLVLSGGAGQKTVDALWQGLNQWMNENAQRYPDEEERFGYSISSTSETRENMFSVFGAFLFLGLFLGTLFLLAAVLILYYKQLSEGMADRERFMILQKVGMGKSEVRKTIHTQVRIVFFLPLGVAILHTLAAYPMMNLIVKAMVGGRIDSLYFWCMLITSLLFAMIYTIVYAITTHTYTRLVSRRQPM